MLNDTPGNPAGSSCLICSRPADKSYRTCTDCYDRLRETLLDVRNRYLRLDASPGAGGADGGRGAPGFGSRPPANPHIIVMRDWRSKPCEVSYDAVAYVWDRNADDGAGAYVDKREVWYGADGRPHCEQERPVRSVPGTLAALAHLVAEEREVTPPRTRYVSELVRWLDGQMDWITRHDLVADLYRDLRDLQAQLRPVTGDKRQRIGTCPNTVDDAECGATLHAPTRGDSIVCPACERTWHRPEWLELGRLIQVGAA